MSKTIKFTVTDENYAELLLRAGNMSLQDYIRSVLFPGETAITPSDAIAKALAKYKTSEKFTVPEIFGDDWNLPNGAAGQFGRKFFDLVSAEYTTQIRFTGNYNSKRHAIYERI